MYVRILFNNIYIVDERKVTMNDTWIIYLGRKVVIQDESSILFFYR